MEPSRILAIDDVHLTAPCSSRGELVDFYHEVLRLERIDQPGEQSRLMFRGFPRSGPRLIVGLDDASGDRSLRRQVLLQVGCLDACAERLTKRRCAFIWLRGWTAFDQRLTALDPGGNRVEVVSSHAL